MSRQLRRLREDLVTLTLGITLGWCAAGVTVAWSDSTTHIKETAHEKPRPPDAPSP